MAFSHKYTSFLQGPWERNLSQCPWRVEVIARGNSADYGTLLGIVVAHKVGHVLLPGRPHTIVGLMRPVCDGQQIRAVALGALAFSSEQSAIIKR